MWATDRYAALECRRCKASKWNSNWLVFPVMYLISPALNRDCVLCSAMAMALWHYMPPLGWDHPMDSALSLCLNPGKPARIRIDLANDRMVPLQLLQTSNNLNDYREKNRFVEYSMYASRGKHTLSALCKLVIRHSVHTLRLSQAQRLMIPV